MGTACAVCAEPRARIAARTFKAFFMAKLPSSVGNTNTGTAINHKQYSDRAGPLAEIQPFAGWPAADCNSGLQLLRPPRASLARLADSLATCAQSCMKVTRQYRDSQLNSLCLLLFAQCADHVGGDNYR